MTNKEQEKTIRDMITRKIDMASPEAWTYIYELIDLKVGQAKDKWLSERSRMAKKLFDLGVTSW